MQTCNQTANAPKGEA
ncbi:hypothetical protein [Methanimicrococcus hongohii]